MPTSGVTTGSARQPSQSRPLIVAALPLVDHLLADPAVGAADADVLVAAAEAAHGVALEVGQHNKGIVVGKGLAHGHVVEPLAAIHGQIHSALGVGDVHRAEGPAIDLQGLAVLFGGVAVALIEGVGLDDGSLRQVALHQLLHPLVGDDVRTVLLAGVQLDGYLAPDFAAYPRVESAQAPGGQVAGEIDDGFVAPALLIGHIALAAQAGNDCGHGIFSFWSV